MEVIPALLIALNAYSVSLNNGYKVRDLSHRSVVKFRDEVGKKSYRLDIDDPLERR
jgi:hypothetical protein